MARLDAGPGPATRRFPWSYLVIAASIGVILSFPLRELIRTGSPFPEALTSITGRPISVSTSSSGPISSCCSWSPYLLSEQGRRAAVDLVRKPVPSLVGNIRRQLSVELALGALEQHIPGDFVETGVYTGGTSILLYKVLEKWDANGSRRLWAADSFQGLPDVVEQDAGAKAGEAPIKGNRGDYATTLDVFTANLVAAEIPFPNNPRLEVLVGFFNETLPASPIKQVSFLRLDGDIYASTMDALTALYDFVSPGGLIYADDYGSYTGCQRAVNEFRILRGVTCPLMFTSLPESIWNNEGASAIWEGAWWVKEAC